MSVCAELTAGSPIPTTAPATRQSRILQLEEHSVHGGLGSAGAEVLAQSPIPAKLSILGMRDFGESGDLGELLEKYGFDAGTIAKKAKEMLGK